MIVDVYEKIEATTKRLEMTDYLVSLFSKTPKEIIDKVVYLTQGKLYPDYVGIELGVAEKLTMRAIAIASGLSLKEIENEYKKTGDIGLAAEKALKRKRVGTLMDFFGATSKIGKLTVQQVYETLDRIAKATGAGSQDTKIRLLVSLLKRATPREAKYLVRTVTGRLRLGIADMTILDALAIAFCKTKDVRPAIERAYNISSDLGAVAKVLAYEGLEGIKKFRITVGRPIRPMLAERLSSAEEILEKLGGKCAAEYKYDGERVQAHKKGDEVTLFSRRLETVSYTHLTLPTN